MTAPPKEKAAPLEAAPIQTSDAENNLSQTHATCKKKAPPGYGWENGEIVPFAPNESDEGLPISERREYARLILGLSQWVHADKLTLRWTAAFIALDTLHLDAKEVAAKFEITERRARQLIAEARAELARLREESEARP